ncbi:MAG: hypothetical protein L0Z53_22890 [Acidobacteriales bacterium]|nr:hypothetical protein [Terriglobales bacterium]
MPSQTRSPSTVTQDGFGFDEWQDAIFAAASDNAYASATGSPTSTLSATNYGFTLPSDATVTGIELSIERHDVGFFGGGFRDLLVSLIRAGIIEGANKATATQWPDSDEIATYGSSNDLWTLAFTAAQVNSSQFGAALRAESIGGGFAISAHVDHMQLTVHYTTPPLVQGPYRAAAVAVHQPGAVALEIHRPGPVAQYTHQLGPVSSYAHQPGASARNTHQPGSQVSKNV